MAYQLQYVATLVQTDRFNNPIGPSYVFNGTQFTPATVPQTSDLTALATAMSADVSAKMVAQFPVQNAADSDNAGSGGAG